MSTYTTNNKWIFNQDSVKAIFTVHDWKGILVFFTIESSLMPTRRRYAFLFWCVDENLTEECKIKYDRTKTLIFTSETILYEQLAIANCTVEFDVNRGYDLSENERNVTTMFDQEIREPPVISGRGYTIHENRIQ